MAGATLYITLQPSSPRLPRKSGSFSKLHEQETEGPVFFMQYCLLDTKCFRRCPHPACSGAKSSLLQLFQLHKCRPKDMSP
uniref:Histone deacetylase 14 n=1 Tax=Rhizophora mucronata TaxID=61149 RepID=A0A2P2KYS0_RHIMU